MFYCPYYAHPHPFLQRNAHKSAAKIQQFLHICKYLHIKSAEIVKFLHFTCFRPFPISLTDRSTFPEIFIYHPPDANGCSMAAQWVLNGCLSQDEYNSTMRETLRGARSRTTVLEFSYHVGLLRVLPRRNALAIPHAVQDREV